MYTLWPGTWSHRKLLKPWKCVHFQKTFETLKMRTFPRVLGRYIYDTCTIRIKTSPYVPAPCGLEPGAIENLWNLESAYIFKPVTLFMMAVNNSVTLCKSSVNESVTLCEPDFSESGTKTRWPYINRLLTNRCAYLNRMSTNRWSCEIEC